MGDRLARLVEIRDEIETVGPAFVPLVETDITYLRRGRRRETIAEEIRQMTNQWESRLEIMRTW